MRGREAGRGKEAGRGRERLGGKQGGREWQGGRKGGGRKARMEEVLFLLGYMVCLMHAYAT